MQGSVATHGGYALKTAAHADGEAADGPPASLLEQHGETAVVVSLVVEIRVVRLRAAFDRRLQSQTRALF